MTPPPPPPCWFGPRASTDDPAVAALLDQVAPARTWQDIGGSFNLNVRLDAAAPLVLRVHRPWATRGRVAGLRRLRERLQRAGIRVAQPVPILGRDLRDAYDSSAPEPVTPDERRLLAGQITLIPLHWVATAGFMDEPIGVQGAVGVSEAERAMDAAEAWWARREELTW